MTELRVDGWPRQAARQAYRISVGMAALAGLRPMSKDGLRVFYGGARAGDVGGPLVKVKRLRERFPESRVGYNLVYCLSNAPYLPGSALRVIKALGVPLIVNQNGVFYRGWYGGDWLAMNREMATAYHLADYVFWQSAFCRRAADRFLGERSGAGEVLHNAVDTARFRPLEEPRPARLFTFLVTGKFDSHLFYRLQASIESLAVLNDAGFPARLTIAGWTTEPARARARELARKLGVADDVTLTGAYTQEQAPEIYRAADAYLMLKHNDPCPNTVLEAMACGLPVVYGDTGGVGELVGDDAGIGVPCAEDWDQPRWPNAQAVAAAMRTVAESRDRFAASARRRAVEKFDIAPWLKRHEEIFREFVAKAA